MPHLDFAPLDEAAREIRRSSSAFDADMIASSGQVANAGGVHRVNIAMMAAERAIRRTGGLPGRPYYENELYAPGRLWDTVPVPAVGDAILDGRWAAAADQIYKAAQTLRQMAFAIKAAREALNMQGAPLSPVALTVKTAEMQGRP